MKNCMDCKYHDVLPDPDPDDWFCDDDLKVICTLRQNVKPKLSPMGAVCAAEPYITVACRPYKLREECEVPEWCPLKNTPCHNPAPIV